VQLLPVLATECLPTRSAMCSNFDIEHFDCCAHHISGGHGDVANFFLAKFGLVLPQFLGKDIHSHFFLLPVVL
jgi:hypothetical protein